jgi:hypothetical protein
MKTVSFSFVSKFPAKKVTDCFTNPDFAKAHTASKLFGKTGIFKADKKMIVRTLAITGADKSAVPVVAVITFADAESGAATQVNASFVNVPDDKADAIKGLGKIIGDEIKTFLTPKPAPAAKPAAKPAKASGAVKKAGAKPAPSKPAVAKPSAEKKAPAKPASAKKPAAKTSPAEKK